MQQQHSQSPRLALNVDGDPQDSFILGAFDQDLYVKLSDPLIQHKIPTLQPEANITSTAFLNSFEIYITQLKNVLKQKNLIQSRIRI